MKSDREGLPPFSEPKAQGHSLTVLFLVIVLGVSGGNLLSTVIIAKYAEYQLAQAAKKIEHETAKINLEREKVRRERAKEEAERRAQREKAVVEAASKRSQTDEQRRNALRQATQTCTFWRDVYTNEKNDYNRGMMNDACARMNSFR